MDQFTLEEAFIRSSAGFPPVYEQLLASAESILLSLQPHGRNFLETLNKCGFTEIVMKTRGAEGVSGWFASYPYHHDLWWGDQVPVLKGNSALQYNAAALDLENAFGLKVHEGTHGLQNLSAACLHASPINFRFPIVLSPYDKVLTWEVYERDAHAKQAWLMYLASRQQEFRDWRESTLVKGYLTSQKAASKPEAILMRTGQYLMDNYMVRDKQQHIIPLRDFIHRDALENYSVEFRLRKSNGGERGNAPVTFVRLEEDDLASIPSGFGPNFMKATGRAYQAPLGVLSPEDSRFLGELEKEFGISDRNSLPTFKEALLALNMSPQAYVGMSMCRPMESVYIPCPKP